jgi:adenosine/AMP kinase
MSTPYWAPSHFVKTLEDIHEALVQNICENKFGVAFYEASDVMASLARDRRGDVRSHRVTRSRFFPVKVLNAIKTVPEVCTIRRTTANPIEVVIVETEPGRHSGVIDGSRAKAPR